MKFHSESRQWVAGAEKQDDTNSWVPLVGGMLRKRRGYQDCLWQWRSSIENEARALAGVLRPPSSESPSPSWAILFHLFTVIFPSLPFPSSLFLSLYTSFSFPFSLNLSLQIRSSQTTHSHRVKKKNQENAFITTKRESRDWNQTLNKASTVIHSCQIPTSLGLLINRQRHFSPVPKTWATSHIAPLFPLCFLLWPWLSSMLYHVILSPELARFSL